MDFIRLGQMVRFHRRKARLTQAELAKMAGIGKTTVFDLEKGKTSIQLSSILRVFKVLNIEIVFCSPIMKVFDKSYE